MLRKAALLGLGLLGIVSIFLLSISSFLTNELFDSSWVLYGCLLLAFSGYAVGHFLRGTLAGTGRFQAVRAVHGFGRADPRHLLRHPRHRRGHGGRRLWPARRPAAAHRGGHRPPGRLPPDAGGSRGGVERDHPEPRLAGGRVARRRCAGQRRAHRSQPAGLAGSGHHRLRVQLRGAGGTGTAVHVPGHPGRAAPQAGPAGRAGALRRLQAGLPPADEGRRGRRPRRCLPGRSPSGPPSSRSSSTPRSGGAP